MKSFHVYTELFYMNGISLLFSCGDFLPNPKIKNKDIQICNISLPEIHYWEKDHLQTLFTLSKPMHMPCFGIINNTVCHFKNAHMKMNLNLSSKA